ncbi:cytochrome P450, partial [Gautieria morchelliformis]
HIPAVKDDGIFGSYATASKWIRGMGRNIITGGYKKHKPQLFRIPMWDHWLTIASGPLLEELANAPEDELSFAASVDDTIQTTYTHRMPLRTSDYHLQIVRERLSPAKMGNIHAALLDETVSAVNDEIGPADMTGWKPVQALRTIQMMVARVTSRIWVGNPGCRDAEYLKMSVKFGLHVMVVSRIINLFPAVLKPLIGTLLSYYNPSLKKATLYIKPLIIERERLLHRNGWDWSELPVRDDLLSWLMRSEGGPHFDYSCLVSRIMNINLASLHGTSLVLTQVMYDLVSRPSYVALLRDDITRQVNKHGWTKTSFDNMTMLDSFIKESMRTTGGGLAGRRQAVKPFRFSDGTHISAGTFICAPVWAIHADETHYKDPNTFNGLRFHEMRMNSHDDSEGIQHSLVSSRMDFISFGLGKHIWSPGRFFAALEMKTFLAYILLNFDVKLPDGQTERPPNTYVGSACVPDRKASYACSSLV